MITGSNLLLMGLGEPDGNLSAYLYNTALILLFAAIGYWVRMKRIKKEIAPIIEELTDFKANMITE
jgi:multisubunit Na+/H+ antiporter MnhB subunit